jgi:sulfite exporter TauE/SafE
VDFALAISALLMGLAGSPHCVAMCGAACAGIAGRCGGARPQRALLGLHLGRLASYAAGGAVAAAGVGALATLGQWSPALRPMWTLVHAAAFALGVWLLWQGRQPAFLENLGRGTSRELAAAGLPGGAGPRWVPVAAPAGASDAGAGGPLKAGAAGALWLAWPCGLLHSALVMAGLGNSAAGGAAIMAAFAVGTSVGLWLGPALWWRIGTPGAGWLASGGAVRLAGFGLAAASGWALGHDLGARVIAYCLG